ncbi:MAG: hypothetical protein BWY76_02937 [bacterium ADurb.Bin429]|nr:MAG: hypothetical protein BWY76_02937 [bacterium ADurb.Bin429]
MPVSMKSSWTSRRRTGVRLMRYSDSPERKTRRVTVTSVNSVGRKPVALSSVRCTSASPSALRLSEPLKMTSVDFALRSDFSPCSPSTHSSPSLMLLLPEPFGPTMAVMPGPNSSVVRSAKVLKPESSSRLRYMGEPTAAGRGVVHSIRGRGGCWQADGGMKRRLPLHPFVGSAPRNGVEWR